MTKKLNKFIAVALTIVTMSSTFPVQVFANSQNTVPVLNNAPAITNHSPLLGSTYSMQFNWASPTPATDSLPGTDGGGIHWPSQYNVLMRNASLGQATFGNLAALSNTIHELIPNYGPNGPHNPNHSTGIISPTLVNDQPSGSILSFAVMPWHVHNNIVIIDGVPTPQPVMVHPTMAQLMAQGQQMLFLTDIEVTQINLQEPGITLQWDNPRFDTNDAFTGYRLFYRSANNTEWSFLQDVNRATPSLDETIIGGRSFFQFNLPNIGALTTGNYYQFRVMPLTAGNAQISSGNLAIPGITGSFNFAFSGRDFFVDDVYISPELRIAPSGGTHILLDWDVVLAATSVELWELQEPDMPPDFGPLGPNNLITTLTGQGAIGITSHLMPRPQTIRWFIVRYVTSPVGELPPTYMLSNIVMFDPVFNDFVSYSPTIFDIDSTPGPLRLDMRWRAFTRPAYTEAERNDPVFGEGEYYLDKNIVFEVFVADDLDLLGRLSEPLYTIPASELTAFLNLTNTPSNVAPATPGFLSYTNAAHPILTFESAEGGRQPLVDNAIYFVKIQGRRIVNGELSPTLVSQPAYDAIFIPPVGPIQVRPEMVQVRIAEENGVEIIGDTYTTLQWNLRFWEVYDPVSNNWHDMVGVNANGDLVFGRAANALTNRVRLWESGFATRNDLTSNEIRNLLGIGGTTPEGALAVRLVELRNVDYQLHVIPYQDMDDDLEDYVRRITANDAAWQNIGQGTPTPGQGTNVIFHQHQVTGLQPNTTYAMFFRPVSGTNAAWLPTYVLATTSFPRPGLVPTPTVPILEVVSGYTTDHSVRLRWTGSFEGMTFELFYSELLLDYPTGGGRVAITNEQILAGADFTGWAPNLYAFPDGVRIGADGVSRIYFTVTGLLPDTLYHFWIRAVNTDDVQSEWSNPVDERTLPIQPPLPPSGINIGSIQSVNAYNVETTSDISRVGPNHLTIEFNRIYMDLNNANMGPVQTGYTNTGGEATWLSAASIVNTRLTMFSELTANSRHYVRGRTVLTVTRGADNQGLRNYSYIIQMATNPEFLDPIEIVLPTLAPMVDTPATMWRLYSPWSETVFFWSGQDPDGDYDENINPDLFPLPDQDWEVVWAMPGILTYRIRGNQIGADGNRDQQVDQRFISRLVQNRVFNFEVDVRQYGPWPVHTRVVEIPFGVIEAFDERQIDLTIFANNLTLTIPYRSLVSSQVRNIPGLNRFTRTVITLSELNAPEAGVATGLYSRPQQLSVQFIEGNSTVTITEFERPINIEMSMPSSHDTATGSISGYINHANSGGWQRVASNFREPLLRPTVPTLGMTTAGVSFTTWQVGSYTVLSTAAAGVAPGTPPQATLAAMQRVNSHINITDLTTYNESANIHANQLNQLIAAIANGNNSVSINTQLEQNVFQSLGRSGMLVTGETVQRQVGISSLVRLFEVRVGQPVAFFPSVSDSSFGDMSQVLQQHQQNLLKAEALGFITGPTVNPTAPLTFGDVMHILDIILSS